MSSTASVGSASTAIAAGSLRRRAAHDEGVEADASGRSLRVLSDLRGCPASPIASVASAFATRFLLGDRVESSSDAGRLPFLLTGWPVTLEEGTPPLAGFLTWRLLLRFAGACCPACVSSFQPLCQNRRSLIARSALSQETPFGTWMTFGLLPGTQYSSVG